MFGAVATKVLRVSWQFVPVTANVMVPVVVLVAVSVTDVPAAIVTPTLLVMVITGGARGTTAAAPGSVIVRTNNVAALVPAVFVAVTLNVVVEGASVMLGVPLIAPVVVLNATPEGNGHAPPVVELHVNVAAAPPVLTGLIVLGRVVPWATVTVAGE